VAEGAQINFVRAIGEALGGAHSPERTAAAVIETLVRHLPLDRVVVWGSRCADGRFAFLAATRDLADVVPVTRLVQDVASRGEAVQLCGNAAVPDALPLGLARCGAVLLHPLRARGGVLGVVGVGIREAGGISPEIVAAIDLVAPQIAMALENAFLRGGADLAPRPHRVDAPGAAATLVGVSPAFRKVVTAIERLGDVDVTVLLLGASGTGKERVARALHDGGRRRGGPFVAVNCAALPESLLEAELFGIERGIATGVDRRPGLVERAHGGTLFLDEIGDMSPGVQAKVLRVLQEREIVRVGGSRPIGVDVRLIAATNCDLEAAVRAGTFREDLYFRICVAPLRLPRLADRIDDIPVLAEHLLARFGGKHGRSDLRLAPDALAWLATRPWPGNVRELENVVERAVVMATGPLISIEDLDPDREAPRGAAVDFRGTLESAVGGAERALIERALVATRNNRTQAARLLGIGRRTLLYKLKRYGIGDAPVRA